MVGTILRFYNFSQIPFSHDEFSALFRIGFTDFETLIKKGVLTDFHPAAVQVFLNYYGEYFGYSEWILKFPFALFGLASVYLCFLIGKEWFNERTGLLAAAFLSCTQFFVFYSQIARPYSAGLFFGLLAILHWHRFLFSGKTVPFKSLVAWVLSAATCAYIHYYLLLSLIILGLLGLLFSPKERRALCILSGLLIFVLYTPHLDIFLQQSSKGGVGTWLGPPDLSFILDFSGYLLQFSYVFGIFVLAILLFSLLKNPQTGKNWWIAMGIFSFSLLAGFLYSIFVNPILQFSGLLFSSPFLVLALFYWASKNKRVFYFSFFGILITGSYALIFDREHYSVFYQSPYEYLVKDLKSSLDEESNNVLSILNDRADILKYYLDKYDLESNSVFLAEHKTSLDFKRLFENSSAEKLYLGAFASSPPELIAMAQEYFPKMEKRRSYFQGEYFVFSKNEPSPRPQLIYLKEELLFNTQNHAWRNPDASNIIVSDSLGTYLNIPQGSSDNPKFEIHNPKSLIPSSNIFIDFKMELQANSDLEGVFCVFSLQEKGKIIQWYAKPLKDFQSSNEGSKFSIIHSLTLNQKILKKENLIVKGFIYNKDQKSYKLYSATYQLRVGNPKLYSLYTPLGF